MSKRILRNRLFSKRLKIKQNTDYSHSQSPHSFWYVLFPGWGKLFSKWENWCPSQCGPKADFQSVLRTLESLFTTFCFVLCKTSQNVAFRIYLHEVNWKFYVNRHYRREALCFILSNISLDENLHSCKNQWSFWKKNLKGIKDKVCGS